MEAAFTFLNRIPADKARHALIGGLLSTFVLVLLLPFFPAVWCCAIAAVFASLVGAWKEQYDKAHKANHTPDPLDWVATTLGGVVPILPLVIYVLICWLEG